MNKPTRQDTVDLIGSAVYENKSLTLQNLSDRAFAQLFRGLVYPQIWEDPVCDMEALGLSERDNVVCIASGGCNMMSYLTRAPQSVTVVDLSPWHVQLNRLKALAAQELPDYRPFYDMFGHADLKGNVELFDRYLLPKMDAEAREFWNGLEKGKQRKTMFARGFYRFGVLGNFISAVHLISRVAKVDFSHLLNATSLAEQQAFFDREIAPMFETRFVKIVARRRASLFGLGIPPAQYDKLAADAGGDVIPVLKERTRKLFCDFPIGENYFAWQAANRAYKEDGTGPVPPYLEKRHYETVRTAAPRVTVHNRSVTDVLAEAPEGSKSVYVLLDAQDWMTDEQLTKLWTQITRTAAPGSRVLFRTGGAPDILPGRVPEAILGRWAYDAAASQRAFETDRSAIYGGVHLYHFKG
jgi:S-adenosylmethionine-diacylglycerol 3-amino-3-carboxypropyl transferase